MMLHGYITFPSSHIPNFDLFISTSTGKDIPVFIIILVSYTSITSSSSIPWNQATILTNLNCLFQARPRTESV
uniref:Periodic tryptophan protein 1 homolog n=1 Tax=Rhizophora mucronata TaxID=61149 RepID=A0A2P2MFG8_RHIMU